MNLISHIHHSLNYFNEQFFLSKLSKRQIVIVCVALAALSCLIVIMRGLWNTKLASIDFSTDKELSNKDNLKIDTFGKRASFDKELPQYDVFSGDLQDKVIKEKGEAQYHLEVNNIKTLKQDLTRHEGKFTDLLKQEYSQFVINHSWRDDWLLRFGREIQYLPNEELYSKVVYTALKVREVYRTTHYTFLHGRTVYWKIFSYFTKTFIKVFNPDVQLDLMEFLRPPFKSHAAENVGEFINRYHKVQPITDDNSIFYNTQLLPVDAYWLNDARDESALYFFALNRNFYDKIGTACAQFIDSWLSSDIPNRKGFIKSFVSGTIEGIVAQVKDSISKLDKNLPGELAVICIPKELVHNPNTNCIYHSLPYGKPYKDSVEPLDVSLLQKLQSDQPPFDESLIRDNFYKWNEKSSYQYRILVSHLTPKNGVRILGVNALTKDLKRIYKKPIQELVRKIVEFERPDALEIQCHPTDGLPTSAYEHLTTQPS